MNKLATPIKPIFEACQFKFAFNVDTSSALAWPEYFGFYDMYDMLKSFLSTKLTTDDTLEFSGTDGSGASYTVVFETTIEPENFDKDYKKALELLEEVNANPPYNTEPLRYNTILETLEESGIPCYEGEPISKMFADYNLIENGYRTFEEHYAHTQEK